MLCPERRDKDGKPEVPSEFELNHIRNDKATLKVIRNRLSDISWWMRLLSHNIAQRANKEDGEVGKFFQALYRAVRLLDETAILACAAYVDLNPIRAALADTIEDSDFTSAQKRCCDVPAKCSVASVQSSGNAGDESPFIRPIGHLLPRDGGEGIGRIGGRHLAPVQLVGGSSSTGPCVNKQGTRCSNKGFLPMSMADYLSLLDWTARQIRADKRGATPKQFAPLFDRMGISAEIWCRLVKDFVKLFSIVAGQPRRIDEHRSKGSSRRYRSRKETRELLASA
jgi:hypothetical protein